MSWLGWPIMVVRRAHRNSTFFSFPLSLSSLLLSPLGLVKLALMLAKRKVIMDKRFTLRRLLPLSLEEEEEEERGKGIELLTSSLLVWYHNYKLWQSSALMILIL